MSLVQEHRSLFHSYVCERRGGSVANSCRSMDVYADATQRMHEFVQLWYGQAKGKELPREIPYIVQFSDVSVSLSIGPA